MKDNRKTIQVLLIFTVIFSIMGGSLAYWNWNTTERERTNVVFTVTSDFSCAADGGGNITNNDVMLAPTTCTDTSRAIKRKVTVTPTLNRDSMTLSMDLWLTINDLGEGLKKSNNFRYVLTTSSNSCEEGTIMASGNFKGRKVGNKVNLLTNELYTETPTEPEEYWLYIWLDEEETSSSTMNQTFSLSLGGQCEEVETLKGDAYALYSESDQSLTFVRSETPITAGSEYDGKVVTEVFSDIETADYSIGGAPWYSYNNDITKVEFKDTIRPISTAHWFNQFYEVTGEFNLDNLDTSQVTDMLYMFAHFRMSGLNEGLDLSHFDTSKVQNMGGVFYHIGYYGPINITGWDVSNVTDMGAMFVAVGEPFIEDISSWDTSNVTNMSGMFESYHGDRLDLSNWNVSNVTDMSSMFYEGSYVGTGLDKWDTSNVIDMSGMFSYSELNSTLDLSNWNVLKVTNYSGFSNSDKIIPPVWKNAYLKIYSETDNSLRIYSDLNVPKVGDIYDGRIVTKVHNISSGTGSFSCSTTITPMIIIVEDNISPTSLSSWFSGCTKVNYVDITKLDVSNVSSLSSMFNNVGSDSSVTSFTIIGLDKWNTSNVTSMYEMFYNTGLNANYTLDLSGWDVSKVTNQYHTNFDYGVESKIIDPLWNTSN